MCRDVCVIARMRAEELERQLEWILDLDTAAKDDAGQVANARAISDMW
jgi:hypothetical protein